MDVRLDHLNKTLATSADDAVAQGRFDQIGVNVARAIFRTFIVHAVATAVTTSLTFLLLMQIMLQTGDSLTESLMVIGTYIVPALGVAVAMIMVRPRAGMAIASVTFAIVVASIMQAEYMSDAISHASPISRWTLCRVFFRSFFLQAANNYERMQNVGFAYCMMPALTDVQWRRAPSGREATS